MRFVVCTDPDPPLDVESAQAIAWPPSCTSRRESSAPSAYQVAMLASTVGRPPTESLTSYATASATNTAGSSKVMPP